MPVLKQKAEKAPDPARTLVIGFAVIILVGTLLLCLPISSRERTFTPLFDCLYTATSATCVTGLVIYDTYTHWSFFGQAVIALLIQVGGLGFVTIITFFNVMAGKKLGYHTLKDVTGDYSENFFEGGKKILINLMKYSGIFELAGAVILAFVFVPRYGAYGIWVSVFMSITAFCNAGFDLMGIDEEFSSLTLYSDNALVLVTIAMLIIVGGLGFIVWENFLNFKSSRKMSLHTKAVLLMTGILIAGGTVFYLLAEWSNPATLGGMNFGEKLLNAFFSSVTARTAGYNSISVDGMSEFSQLGTVFFMLVGAAPASTGGGIKVTTLLVLVMTVVSYIRNKNDVEIMGHRINKLAVYRTLVIVTLSCAAVMVCFSAMYFSMPEGTSGQAIQCLFDAASAFSTAGLSTGAAAMTGIFGKAVIVLTMFAGRVGPVSIILSIVMRSANRKSIVVPDGQIIIG